MIPLVVLELGYEISSLVVNLSSDQKFALF